MKHSGPSNRNLEKKKKLIFENVWLEIKIQVHLELQTKLLYATKVMSVGAKQNEGFLLSSNFNVFKNQKSSVKQKNNIKVFYCCFNSLKIYYKDLLNKLN